MYMKNAERYSVVVLLVLSSIFLILFYGKVLTSPNSFLFSTSGDGIKNYFTYVSQVKEPSYTESHAMNYPYGESFLYLDCHPAFTVVIKALAVPFPSIQNYSVGIINFLMLFSVLLSAYLLYHILVRFQVNRLFAALSAFAIAVLAPQILRVPGHMALSYSFFIPLSWYLYLRFSESQHKLKWSLIICLNILFWFFVHGYLGMIAAALLLLVFLFDFVVSEERKYKSIRQWAYVFIQSVLPLVIFYGFAKLSDSHVGRTNNPYGFLVYTSNFDSIFFPSHEPLKPLLDKVFSIEQIWEGWAYIGIGSIVTIIVFFFYRLVNWFRKSQSKLTVMVPHQLIIALCASVVLLLFSFGYPFKWRMEFLLDKLSIIKNFRGIGRFSWVFYYVITVSSICVLYKLYIANGKKLVYAVLCFCVPTTYVIEGIPYHKEVGEQIIKTPNLFDYAQLDSDLKSAVNYLHSEKYQAIIPLPYYHIGSENYGKTATDKIYLTSMLLSYHSGIPLMSNYSTRTSIPESKKLLQLISPTYYSKEIESDLKSDKPFLIIYSNENLSEYETMLLEKGEKLFSTNDYSLYSLSKKSLLKNTSREVIEEFKKIKDELVSRNGFLVMPQDTSAYLHYNSFDDNPQPLSFRGDGAYSGIKKDYNLLLKFDSLALEKDKEYTASFWMYNEGENFGQDVLGAMLFLQIEDPSGKIEWTYNTNPSSSAVINGSWSLVEMDFTIPNNDCLASLYLKGDERSLMRFYLDELLIREKNTTCYKIIQSDGDAIKKLFFNNHQIMW